MDILVNVAQQKLRIAANLRKVVAGSQEFVRFIFNFDEEWDGLLILKASRILNDGRPVISRSMI